MKRDEEMPTWVTETMEERVRDAFGAAAETITALDLPPQPALARRSGSARRRPAWVLPGWALGFRGRALFPVAAAAAVTAIALTAAGVIPGLFNGSPGGAQAQTAGGPLPGAPRFFAGIVVEPSGGHRLGPRIGNTVMHRSDEKFVAVVKIFNSATGTPAAALRSPASQYFQAVSRLGDDQTFVAASYDRSACVTHLWKFAINPAGKPGRLTPLPVPQLSGDVEELTSSADGKVLAFSLSACRPNSLQIGVIHLATGQITRWRNPGIGGSLSLTADGSKLGFVITRRLGAQPYAAWTIPTDAPAGPLLSQARQAPGLGRNVDEAILSPSGAQIYVEAQPRPPAGPVILSLHTTSTGSLVRQVIELNPGGPDVSLSSLGLDAAGQHLLAYGFGGVEAIDLSSGRHLSLPVSHPYIEGAFTTFAW